MKDTWSSHCQRLPTIHTVCQKWGSMCLVHCVEILSASVWTMPFFCAGNKNWAAFAKFQRFKIFMLPFFLICKGLPVKDAITTSARRQNASMPQPMYAVLTWYLSVFSPSTLMLVTYANTRVGSVVKCWAHAAYWSGTSAVCTLRITRWSAVCVVAFSLVWTACGDIWWFCTRAW